MEVIILDPMAFNLNVEQQNAINYLKSRNYPDLLLTGDAGTGKSTVIKTLIKEERMLGKNVVVTASTGFAASLLGGMTYYKAFNIYPGVEYKSQSIVVPKNIIEADYIIIDEVSMITAEMFDLIFQELEYVRMCKNSNIQLILVGDFSQLPPITGKGYHNMHWLFESNAFKNVQCIRLRNKVRQEDDLEFSVNLDKIKMQDDSCLDYINKNCSKEAFVNAPYLCGIREKAEEICKSYLRKLNGEEYEIDCEILGEGLTSISRRYIECSRLEKVLLIKKEALVRFTINDDHGRFVNGTEGVISGIIPSEKDNQRVERIIVRRTDNNELIELERVTLLLDGSKDTYISQFPIRLSYAMTIHKAQGMTFDKVNIIPAGWEPGQLYVALSRARHIGDIFLYEEITPEMIKCDPRVIKFYNDTRFL